MSDGPLQSLVNGKQAAHIAISDRGFQYGDGCFETVRIINNETVLWSAHVNRLQRACDSLALDFALGELQQEVATLLEAQELPSAILKIMITRGEGGRGYAPTGRPGGTRVLQLFNYAAPDTSEPARVIICRHRLSSSRQLAGIKHLNRLDQVLASAQIPEGFDEGLCRSQTGDIIEGCRTNIVLVAGDKCTTPDLSDSGVRGLMLDSLLSKYAEDGVTVESQQVSLEQLRQADAMFLCNSVFGVWPIGDIYSEEHAPLCSMGTSIHSSSALQFSKELFRSAT